MQVLGIRYQPQHAEQSRRVQPPIRLPSVRAGLEQAPIRQVRHHQPDDQQGDQGRSQRQVLSQCLRTQDEAAEAQTHDARQHCHGPRAGEGRIPRMPRNRRLESAQASGKVLEADPREGEEPPHHQRVKHASHGPLANDPSLQHDLREHGPKPRRQAVEWQVALLGAKHRSQAPGNCPAEIAEARQGRKD